ncbi:MAG: DUF896 domain-containing protein [Lachnospiraceae bacterium]|nr:DUF896 domain-containing protein [Lachnospiraceae bacterium]
MDMKDIDRINALYHKAKSVGLTPEEAEEQATLRRDYIAAIRANLRGSLNSITVEYPDGHRENLGEKYGGQTPKKPS